MKSIVCMAALAVAVIAQSDSSLFDIAPDSDAPSDCSSDLSGPFAFNTVDADTDGPNPGKLICGNVTATLNDGVLVDTFRRTGSIVSNQQFQFDGPPQAGSQFSAGWSACTAKNGKIGHLRLGSNETFYNCYNAATADKPAFYNIYNAEIGNCTEVYLTYAPCTYVPDSGSLQPQTLQAGRCGLPPYDLENPTANLDIPAYPEDCPDAAAPFDSDSSSDSSSSSASESSSATSTSSMSISSVSMSSVPMSGPQDFMTMMTESLAPMTTSAAAAATPAPASNATVSAATGTGATVTGPTSAPSPFTGAASAVAACKGFVAVVAGVAAFALF